MIQELHDNDYEAPVLAGFMLWLIILLVIGLTVWMAPKALADPVLLQFNGTMTSGTGVGSLSYDTAAAPIATNFGGMQNAIYSPTSWDFVLLSTFIPSQFFSSALIAQSGSLCVGICTFASGQQLRLDLSADSGMRFHMSFNLTEPILTPPRFDQIGSFNQAVYRDERFAGTTRVALFQTGSLTQVNGGNGGSVPVPDMALLTGILGVLMMGYRVRKDMLCR